MTSPVKICSDALLLLGANTISSFTEGSAAAKLCSNLYAGERDALLRMHPWNCCIRRVVLAPEVTAPVNEYQSQFILPDDCLRVLDVLGDWRWPGEYQVEGRRILSGGTALPLRYVARVDEAEWDPMLVKLMKLAMVAVLAYPITKSGTAAEGARADFERALRQAKAVDGQENPPETLEDSPLLDARRGYSSRYW